MNESTLPEWPEELSDAIHAGSVEIMDYEHERAEAAIARLHVLVSALTAVTHAPVDEKASQRLSALKEIASDALNSIGPCRSKR